MLTYPYVPPPRGCAGRRKTRSQTAGRRRRWKFARACENRGGEVRARVLVCAIADI